MTKVLLTGKLSNLQNASHVTPLLQLQKLTTTTGGSGFIAAHIIDVLLEHGHSVVTTVRSEQKANKIREAHPNTPKEKLDFRIVEDIAQEGAFDEAVKIDGLEAVLHTSSPFHFKWVFRTFVRKQNAPFVSCFGVGIC